MVQSPFDVGDGVLGSGALGFISKVIILFERENSVDEAVDAALCVDAYLLSTKGGVIRVEW